MQIGRYKISIHNHGFFRLDGGAMFGVVPKTLWSKDMVPDDQNRILLATRSIIVEDGDRKMIVDLGCGDKWNSKIREIYSLPSEPYRVIDGVTDVFITHLHFDHCGGVSRYEGTKLVANYPSARHFVSAENYAYAKNPHPREKASYLRENIDVLAAVDLKLTKDGDEIWPGIYVHQANGHTKGLHWLTVNDGGETLCFPTDVCPTSSHLPETHALGYDMCAETSIADKHHFLEQAVRGGWVVVFEHDPEVAAGRLAFDDRGRAHVAEKIDFPEL